MALQLILLVPIVGVLCQLVKEAGSCPPENIPVFQDTSPRTPLDGPVQAIVPAYTFTCHGNITLWGACVQPGASVVRIRYDIIFQVFRPSSDGVGCYDMVGSNFLDDGVPGVTGGNIDRCLVLTDIPPEDQIQVQPGDVVGFYAIERRDEDQRDGGVQLNTNISTVNVWSTEILAIIDPDLCPYQIGVGGNLDSSSTAAPVITVQVATITPSMTALATPTPTSFSSPSTTSSQPSRSTLSQPQPPVPSSTNQPVPESNNSKSSLHNLIIYEAIGGVVVLVLIVATVCFIVVKKRGVANISLQDNIQTMGNEAYSTNLTSFAISTAQNDDYGAVETRRDENNIPVIPTSQNEAYGAEGSADTDEGYVINQPIYEEPSAVETNIPVIPTAQNEAYGAVGPGEEDIEYDYVTR